MKLNAILELHPQFIRDLLQLPDGCEVTGIEQDIDNRGPVLVRIDGAGWPVHEGEYIPRATGVVTQESLPDGRKLAPVIDWGFPKGEAQ